MSLKILLKLPKKTDHELLIIKIKIFKIVLKL